MAATAALPGLSDIGNLNTRHLSQLAADFSAEADLIENSFTEAHEQLSAARWDGQANDAALHRTDTDRVRARGHAEGLREAADIARYGDEDLRAAQRRVLNAVGEARDAGFVVNDDLSVTDSTTSKTLQEYLARQEQAQELAADIREYAATLVATDQNIAAKLSAATVGLSDPQSSDGPLEPPPQPHNGHIHAVDHTWKTGPDQPAPPSGPRADDIRGVIDKLPVGDSPEVREVRTLKDLQNLWEWAKQDGVEIPNGYGDPDKGIRYRLPDGTTIGQRWAGESTGKPVLDVRVPGKDGYTKVHINPQGGVPDIPAPAKPGPGEAQPPRPAPVEAAPPTVEPVPPHAASPAKPAPAEPPRPAPPEPSPVARPPAQLPPLPPPRIIGGEGPVTGGGGGGGWGMPGANPGGVARPE